MFQAEFPAVEQSWSVPVALSVLVQMLATGETLMLMAEVDATSIATAKVLNIFTIYIII